MAIDLVAAVRDAAGPHALLAVEARCSLYSVHHSTHWQASRTFFIHHDSKSPRVSTRNSELWST